MDNIKGTTATKKYIIKFDFEYYMNQYHPDLKADEKENKMTFMRQTMREWINSNKTFLLIKEECSRPNWMEYIKVFELRENAEVEVMAVSFEKAKI